MHGEPRPVWVGQLGMLLNQLPDNLEVVLPTENPAIAVLRLKPIVVIDTGTVQMKNGPVGLLAQQMHQRRKVTALAHC